VRDDARFSLSAERREKVTSAFPKSQARTGRDGRTANIGTRGSGSADHAAAARADGVRRRAGGEVQSTTGHPIIGRRRFVDGVLRPVFLDHGGHQYIIVRDGHTRCYGAWLTVEDAGDADAPLVVRGPT